MKRDSYESILLLKETDDRNQTNEWLSVTALSPRDIGEWVENVDIISAAVTLLNLNPYISQLV